MKKTMKLFGALLAVMMIVTCAVNAGLYDDVFDNLTLSEFAYYEQGTLDAYQMRAFAVDPNGKYYYGGLLQGTSPTVYQFDAKTGAEVCSYVFDEDEDPGAYIKAIAVDDRGYVYMGVANKANNGAVYFAICEENGLNPVKWVKIEIEGKVGINGACIRRDGDKYYLYFVTNYETDRLYCYDVTNVNSPVLNSDFGNDGVNTGIGYLDLTSAFGMDDANNICVDSLGCIYMCANTGNGSKGDTVFKIDNKGTGVLGTVEIPECFGVAVVGGYVAVCTYQGADSQLYILDQSSLAVVKTVGYDNASNFTQLGMIGNKLYMADQGPDAVLVSSDIIFPVVEEPAADTPAEGGDTAGEAVDTAPAAPTTADAGIVVASVVLACAAAVVLKSRKH
ncbi:MAG: hypothetical protein ACI3XM_00855 [Eubacteriales bacterium]